MAESGVREIQLSGKQLVFLFMASVVFVVVIFLLGVSVGRGTHGPIPTVSAADASVAAEPPAPTPPGIKAPPSDLTYKDLKTGDPAAKPADAGATKAEAPKPAPAPVTPPPAAEAPAKTTPPPPAPAPASKSAAATPAPATTKATTPAPTTGALIQVSSFKSKELADALVTKLKTKGYEAFIVDQPKAPFLHMVRVGPYPQRLAADEAVVQLKKDGFPPSVVLH